MDFNEKHIQHIDNLLKYIMRSHPPSDAVGEEMLALAHGYYFLQELKKVAIHTMQQKKAQEQALSSAFSQDKTNNIIKPSKSKRQPGEIG
jgi:hypothetical protein